MTTPPANLPEGETTTPDEDFEILDASNVSLCSVSAETYLSLPEVCIIFVSLCVYLNNLLIVNFSLRNF